MKLITEEVSNVKIITEGKGSKKRMCIEGIFLQGEIKNRNGRMYPISISIMPLVVLGAKSEIGLAAVVSISITLPWFY